MHSIRTKITIMTVLAVVTIMVISAVFGVIAIRDLGSRNAEQTLMLLCETGQKNLNHYFESVEQSVEMVLAYVESDLDGLEDDKLQAHLDRVRRIFKKLAYKTDGVLTYYYRIDPEISRSVTGFWYIELEGTGFWEHEVTDITRYNTEDTSHLVWFTVPKATGKGVWLPPYITDNLDVKVISYSVPVYYKGQFVGVIGIEIDYSTMADAVRRLTLYENGCAFLNDTDGVLIYHPRIDVTALSKPMKAPEGFLTDNDFLRYSFEGVEKKGVRLLLSNGMWINVAVPIREIDAEWKSWCNYVIMCFLFILALFIFIMIVFSGRITKPLRQLTEAAEQIGEGNYDCNLDYNGRDEVGRLTQTFKKVTVKLKTYISGLNDMAYADGLTSLRNKGAFDQFTNKLQAQIDEDKDSIAFAMCVFDCNNLKYINDRYGHDKGDIYLKESSAVICKVFAHSPVFRIGGDEFVALLTESDYKRRDELLRLFDECCEKKRELSANVWERVDVARGLAVYDPKEDDYVSDVLRRADKKMYNNKRSRGKYDESGKWRR